MNKKTIKLYRFRSLVNCKELERIKAIIKTNKFWCSKFHEMNDPMEGVYHTADVKLIDEIYDEKESYMICSFSGKKGFENPAMWGYYAGGFKGIAIEIEIPECEVDKVKYCSKVINTTDTKGILTSKLNAWKHEDEYRYLKKINKNLNEIGAITKVYIGNPYNNINNEHKVVQSNNILQKYRMLKEELEQFLDENETLSEEIQVGELSNVEIR